MAKVEKCGKFMKYDILIAGVGGQGILSLAYVLDNAAMELGLNFKQTEVHGMAQRGGGVVSHVRMSHDPIHSDMIPFGNADIILSMEPLEALRYVLYLKPNGLIITNSEPVLNISNYPTMDQIKATLSAYRHVILSATDLAREAGNLNAQNMVLLGVLAHYLAVSSEILLKWVKQCFLAKGEKIVTLNAHAFQLGLSHTK